jgi:hypothetical protein
VLHSITRSLWSFMKLMQSSPINQSNGDLTFCNFSYNSLVQRSRGSSASIVTQLRTGRPGFDSWHGQICFLFATGSGAHPASYTVGTRGIIAGAWSSQLTSV